jgi:hypothetical protein
MVTELLRLYAEVALHRRGPEDLPASRAVFVLTVVAYVLVYFAVSLVLPPGQGLPADHLALDVVFTFGWYWLLLRLIHKPERFLQTASATFGYQAIIAPLWIASIWLVTHFRNDAAALMPSMLVWLAILVWILSVNVRILRSALEWPVGACVGLVVLQNIAELMLFGLFPAPVNVTAVGATGA